MLFIIQQEEYDLTKAGLCLKGHCKLLSYPLSNSSIVTHRICRGPVVQPAYANVVRNN